ncbi:MAG: TIR domain-containing protein, partial [Leptolyngbyaceae bacterium]|nr:TIR domain-containing protein [Leptolyngbyaceae bacterium]
QRGITLWTSETDIKKGEDFQEAINRGIERADTVLFLMSPHSLRSAYCQQEIRYAQLYHKRIIPIVIADLEETDIPLELQTLQFVDFQAVDFQAVDTDPLLQASFDSLLDVLDDDADYYRTHKTLLVQALQWDHHERRKDYLLRGNAFVDAENWLRVSHQTAKQPPPTRLHTSFIEESRNVNRYFDAFISYGRTDSLEFATTLSENLSEQGLNVWFDKTDIPLGVDFQQQINDGISKAHNFIFILSPHAVNSDYCKQEIELALRFQKRIIPILHVETLAYDLWQYRNPQGTLEDWQQYQDHGLHSIFPNMNPVIGKINWVYFREGLDDYRRSLESLVALFPRHRTYVEQHTTYLVQALNWQRQQGKTEYLLIGDDRTEAEQWLKTQFEDEQPPCRPTELHAEFICESIKNAANLMTQVFISHAEVDHDVREKVRYSLMCQGITVWINRTDITTGTDFQEEINHGIEETDNVVWLMSPASLASDYCREELEYALSLKKRIIPLLIHDVDMEDLPLGLRSLQFIDCRNFDQSDAYHHALSKLLKTLDEDARYHHQHKLLLVRALRWKQQKYNPSILLRGVELRHFQSWFRAANHHSHFRPIPLQEEFIAESEKQPPDTTLNVFIAYSRSDADFARKLNQTLQIQGMTTWFDQENIESGEDFRTEIFRGIENSENFVFIISPSSVVSSFCNEEVDYAKRLNKRMVTVLYREVSVALLPPALADIQWIDFRRHGGDFLDRFGELLRTLASDPSYVRMHTRLLVRSREWHDADRDDSYLMRGRDLEQAIAWATTADTREPRPTPLQREYIEASRALPLRRIKPRTVVFSSLAVTLVLAIARFFGLTEGLELLAYDHLLRLRGNEDQDTRLTLVTVDSQSNRDLRNRMIAGEYDDYERGYGTIPEGALANVLATLQQYSPRLIALDFYRDFEADPQLAAQMRQMPNLIGACKHAATDENGNLVEGYTPSPELDMQKIGSTDLVDDGGKFVRRSYLFQDADPEYCNTLETLSLVIAKQYLEPEGYTFTPPLTEDSFYLQNGLKFGEISIPALWGDGSGFQARNNRLEGYQTLLNFRIHNGQAEQFVQSIPLSDVLNGPLSPELIRDRIILIGYTDRADINTDYWDTPYGLMAGVHIQGQ